MGKLLSALSSRYGDFQSDLARIKNSKSNKDILEAAVAGCVIIGAADGNYDNKEKDETIDSLAGSKFVEGAGFSVGKITEVANKFTDYRPGSRAGKERLLEEIREAGKLDEIAPFRTAIFMTWLDIAEGDGNIDDKEKKALLQCGEALGLRNAQELIDG